MCTDYSHLNFPFCAYCRVYKIQTKIIMNTLHFVCLTLCFSFGATTFSGDRRSTRTSVRNTIKQNLCSKGAAGTLSRSDFCDDLMVIFPDGTVAQDAAALTQLQTFLKPSGSDLSCSEEETVVTNPKLNAQVSLTRGVLKVSAGGNAPATAMAIGDFCGRYLCEVKREDGRQKICRCSISGLEDADATTGACAAI